MHLCATDLQNDRVLCSENKHKAPQRSVPAVPDAHTAEHLPGVEPDAHTMRCVDLSTRSAHTD